jgi:hypothetical protein
VGDKLKELERKCESLQRQLDYLRGAGTIDLRASRILFNNAALGVSSGGTGGDTPDDAQAALNVGAWKNVKYYGADPTTGVDNSTAIQAAMDAGGTVYLPPGTYEYATTLVFKDNNIILRGAGETKSVLKYTGSGTAVANSAPTTATRYYCGLHDLGILALSNTSYVVDLKSMQFFVMRCVNVAGGGVSGVTGVRMTAEAGVTGCTYNRIENCYILLCDTGILNDYSNSNVIYGTRVQPYVAGGWGYKFSGTGNNNMLIASSSESATNKNGIRVENAVGTSIIGVRLESMGVGIQVDSGVTDTTIVAPYFSSCTTNYTDAGTDTIIVYQGLAIGGASGTRGLSVTSTNTNYLQKELMIATTTDSGVSNTALSISGNLDLKGSSSNIFINGQYAMKARITGMGSALTASTAGAAYGGTEQTMLQDAHDAIRLLMAACKNHGFVAT